MTHFSQRKTRVYKCHSFIQQDTFFHAGDKYLLSFPSVPGLMLALGIQWWGRQSLCLQGNFSLHNLPSLPPTYTRHAKISPTAFLKDGHLALAVWYNETVCVKCPAISKSTPPCLLSTNSKSWEPWIPHQLCIAISHPTLRNSFQHPEPKSSVLEGPFQFTGNERTRDF